MKVMITIEKLRQVEPGFKDLTDEQITKIRDLLYRFAVFALEEYMEEKYGSKNPLGSHGLPVIRM